MYLNLQQSNIPFRIHFICRWIIFVIYMVSIYIYMCTALWTMYSGCPYYYE